MNIPIDRKTTLFISQDKENGDIDFFDEADPGRPYNLNIEPSAAGNGWTRIEFDILKTQNISGYNLESKIVTGWTMHGVDLGLPVSIVYWVSFQFGSIPESNQFDRTGWNGDSDIIIRVLRELNESYAVPGGAE